MDGELSFNQHARCWEGFSEDGAQYLTVSGAAMAEAHHIMTMRGRSSTTSNPYLLLVATWLDDDALRDLDGVDLEDD